ncbi:MAG TPA: DUF4142 domain-containing protein [Methylophilaceae bacterium]|nr:DUF4142 domain-containing protein [Methylophilaceae bacterium]
MKTTFNLLLGTLLAIAATSTLAQSGPTDAQIAAIVVAANSVDIEAGKYAESKSPNEDVKAFAERMVVDHSGVNKQAVALVNKLNVTPEENDTSKSLKQNGADTLAKFQNLNGKEFDKAYIDNEVAYHQAVIDALDNTLIPNAKNEELKALLVKVRPAFIAHLEHAKHMQMSFK